MTETNDNTTKTCQNADGKRKIVLSGIRATGNLHLGNYYGALSKFVKMQDDYDCRFFIADLHALTTHPDPKMLHENVKQILAEYLAAGLDPEKNTIYVQSDIPEISEMYLLMNMHVGIGELMRTASFKDKARKALGIFLRKRRQRGGDREGNHRKPDQPPRQCWTAHLSDPHGRGHTHPSCRLRAGRQRPGTAP